MVLARTQRDEVFALVDKAALLLIKLAAVILHEMQNAPVVPPGRLVQAFELLGFQ